MTGTDRLIMRMRKEGRLSMTESESRKLLSSYGVPVVKDRVAVNEKEAVAYAQKIGFPVVAKGHGANLLHKTERGLVKTDLKSAGEIREAFRVIRALAGNDWEGCLISPFIQGRRKSWTRMIMAINRVA